MLCAFVVTGIQMFNGKWFQFKTQQCHICLFLKCEDRYMSYVISLKVFILGETIQFLSSTVLPL